MLWTVVAISGMLAAEPPEAPRAAVAAIEIAFATQAGEGSAGGKRFLRNGCYQIESGGGTGGPYARDSQAGCHRPADVAAVFAKLDAIGGDALVREGAAGGGAAAEGGAAPGGRAAARGATREGLRPGGSQSQIVLVRSDGSRWVAANQTAANQLLAAVNELPSENQWYATPPAKPVGAGPQLVVLSVMTPGRDGSRRTEAALASDGRWWCYRSVVGERGAEPKLPGKKPPAATAAAARLGRILAGVSPPASDEAPADPDKRSDGVEISVEVAWPGVARAPLRPRRRADAVADRFGAEMQGLSPACAISHAPQPR